MRHPIARRISRIYFRFTNHIKLDNTGELNLVDCLKGKHQDKWCRVRHFLIHNRDCLYYKYQPLGSLGGSPVGVTFYGEAQGVAREG